MKRKKKKTQQRSRGGASYPCLHCDRPTHVVITRRDEEGRVRRVRQCTRCHIKFSTIERAEP